MKQMYFSIFMKSVKLCFSGLEIQNPCSFLLQNSLFVNVKIHLFKPLFIL